MDSSRMKGDDCQLEAPPARRNATEGTPGCDGAGIDIDGSSNGTWRLLESNASMSLPNLE
jgi:hypothetical protein